MKKDHHSYSNKVCFIASDIETWSKNTQIRGTSTPTKCVSGIACSSWREQKKVRDTCAFMEPVLRNHMSILVQERRSQSSCSPTVNGTDILKSVTHLSCQENCPDVCGASHRHFNPEEKVLGDARRLIRDFLLGSRLHNQLICAQYLGLRSAYNLRASNAQCSL